MSRPSWDDYFFGLTSAAATRGTCPRAQIGCVVVNPGTHRVLGTGYNGARTGQGHCADVGCTILAEHCIRAVHAEVNATEQIMPGLRNLVAYVVGPRPVCSHCAAALYAVGVREVKWQCAIPSLDAVAGDIRAWQAETFPRATPESVAEHLRREAEELIKDPSDPEEMADIFHLLVAAVEASGYDLAHIAAGKLALNRTRTWGQPDRNGVVEHLREAVP